MSIAETHIVLLPGLDGTARLFTRFINAAPPHFSLTPLALPTEPLSYAALADRLAPRLPEGRVILIAESFSGPLAIALTERRPISGLVLCNSFVTAPRARVFRWLVMESMFRRPAPEFFLRRYLVGNGADDAIVHEVASTVTSVAPAILAARLRLLLGLNDTVPFARSTIPTLYVRGTDDRVVPASVCRRMLELRRLKIEMVSGPHLLLQVNPTAAWGVIRPFLQSISEATTPAI